MRHHLLEMNWLMLDKRVVKQSLSHTAARTIVGSIGKLDHFHVLIRFVNPLHRCSDKKMKNGEICDNENKNSDGIQNSIQLEFKR